MGMPRLSRIALDYGITNYAENDSEYEISAQIHTSGTIEYEACQQITPRLPFEINAPVLSDACSVSNGAASLIRNNGEPYLIHFDEESLDFGCVRMRVSSSGTFNIIISDENRDFHVYDGSNEVESHFERSVQDCGTFEHLFQFDLTTGSYTLQIAPGEPLEIYIEENCASESLVPRACAGSHSEIITERTGILSHKQQATGRITSVELGIGDQIVVSLTCLEEAPCDAQMKGFFLLKDLDCRQSEACPTNQSCSSEGYCISDSSGCNVSTKKNFSLLSLTFFVLGLIFRPKVSQKVVN